MTTNQARDSILDTAVELTTESVREIKNTAQAADDARRLDTNTYARCPRCYCHHSVRGNFDNLCDNCQQTILIHFPEHESVPFIREALKQWQP